MNNSLFLHLKTIFKIVEPLNNKFNDYKINHHFLIFKKGFSFIVSFDTMKTNENNKPLISKKEYIDLQLFCKKLKQNKINFIINPDLIIGKK